MQRCEHYLVSTQKTPPGEQHTRVLGQAKCKMFGNILNTPRVLVKRRVKMFGNALKTRILVKQSVKCL